MAEQQASDGSGSEPQIVVYGHGALGGFQTDDDLISSIERGVVERGYRYRYTQAKNADVIVLAHKGRALGRFEVLARETPDAADLEQVPLAKSTYLIGKRAIYRKPVVLKDLDIQNYHFGRRITLAKLNEIEGRGEAQEFS
jgi:hypothetical protein